MSEFDMFQFFEVKHENASHASTDMTRLRSAFVRPPMLFAENPPLQNIKRTTPRYIPRS